VTAQADRTLDEVLARMRERAHVTDKVIERVLARER
jgi:hypothetical protein